MLGPKLSDYCHIRPEERSRLKVVIDTEEKVDWARELSRDDSFLTSRERIGRLQDIFRVIKQDGIVHADVSFIQVYYVGPRDYWRFTLNGLKRLCQNIMSLRQVCTLSRPHS